MAPARIAYLYCPWCQCGRTHYIAVLPHPDEDGMTEGAPICAYTHLHSDEEIYDGLDPYRD